MSVETDVKAALIAWAAALPLGVAATVVAGTPQYGQVVELAGAVGHLGIRWDTISVRDELDELEYDEDGRATWGLGTAEARCDWIWRTSHADVVEQVRAGFLGLVRLLASRTSPDGLPVLHLPATLAGYATTIKAYWDGESISRAPEEQAKTELHVIAFPGVVRFTYPYTEPEALTTGLLTLDVTLNDQAVPIP